MDIRSVKVKGNIYLRKEDVVAYLQEMAATEETDTRNRILTAAENLSEVGKKPVVASARCGHCGAPVRDSDIRICYKCGRIS